MTLEKGTRDAIGRTVRALRELFEEEFGKQASGRFGIRSSRRTKATEADGLDAWLDPLESLSLTPAEFAQRDELVHALHYLISEGNEPSEAVARLIREAAFTAVNRLLAVRVAEAIGILPVVLSEGRQSAGFKEAVGDVFPTLASDENAYWTYLQIAGDELATGVPRLFDRRYPTSAFVPSRACVDEALQLLTADELASAWIEPETLGWGYQFFNGDDVKQMREASPAPRNSRELAVRNQFFTPRYVVDWLVQNTLGRRLVQAGYDLDLPLLAGEVDDSEPLDLVDVRVLDPAVGSGHFLLGSYDLLEQAWQSIGIAPSECAAKILPCLFGVDIDPRAAQVAQAVLLLRARRSAPDADLITPPPIVTAVALPHNAQLREEVFGSLSPAAQVAARDMAEALDQAPLLGSLLKVEERLEAEVASFDKAPRLTDGDVNDVLKDLDEALGDLVLSGSSPEQRMFSAEAVDALRFIAICRGRYDTVLMNPPFGEPVAQTADYIRAAYGADGADLFASFVSRGLGLLRPGGRLGAITSRSGFFLTSFREWRQERILPRLDAMLDLGIGVMHDAMVRAAAYVVGHKPHQRSATFYRLIDEPDKKSAVYGLDSSTAYVRTPSQFVAIPEAPAAYWLPERLLELFRDHVSLGVTCDVKQGLATADNFRFVRVWWEVAPDAIGPEHRWLPFATGGAFSPYYADLRAVVDWEDDGRRIVEWGKGRVQNTHYYRRPGLTWNRRSEGFFVALVPAGAAFSNNGQMIFVPNDDPSVLYRLMAYLNSAVAGTLIEPMVGAEQYEVGMVNRIPLVDLSRAEEDLARQLTTELRRAAASADETNHFFVTPWAGPDSSEQLALSDTSAALDEAVLEVLEIEDRVRPLSASVATDWFSRQEWPGKPSAHQELSYCLGAALGRWDIRKAILVDPVPLPDPLEPLPRGSVGMLSRYMPTFGDAGKDAYPIQLPSDQLLHDDPGHERDVVAAIERVTEVLDASRHVPQLSIAGLKDLRKHLRTGFFPEHLKQYSASRRNAPIYWQLAVPSKRWGLWLYAPSLSRESLFAVARAAREKIARLNEQVSLARERAETDRDARERAEGLEDLASEVEKFAAIADQVAQSGWEPDLNDGFILNAAPLEELFVDKTWRGMIAKQRKAMQKGDYPWATVQREFFEAPR